MAITSGALGIVSLILFALFAFPSRPSSLLFTQVNAIFYLLLIFISWLVTRSGQVALGSTLLQIFHVSDVLSIGFGRWETHWKTVLKIRTSFFPERNGYQEINAEILRKMLNAA
jgi:hypothetical protein